MVRHKKTRVTVHRYPLHSYDFSPMHLRCMGLKSILLSTLAHSFQKPGGEVWIFVQSSPPGFQKRPFSNLILYRAIFTISASAKNSGRWKLGMLVSIGE